MISNGSYTASLFKQLKKCSNIDRVIIHIFNTKGIYLKPKEVAGDGLCLYHCCLYFVEKFDLKYNDIQPQTAQELKTFLLSYVDDHKQETISKQINLPCKEILQGKPIKSIVNNNSFWGCDLTLNLFCRLFRFDALLYSIDASGRIDFVPQQPSPVDLEGEVTPSGYIVCDRSIHFTVLEPL